MPRPKTLALRGRVAQRDGGVCVDCPPGTPAWPWEEWEADHEVELVDGGTDDLDNLVTRCKPHHREKTRTRAAEKGRKLGGRPNRDLKLTTFYVGREDVAEFDRLASTYGLTRSDIVRLALTKGLAEAEAELRGRSQ